MGRSLAHTHAAQSFGCFAEGGHSILRDKEARNGRLHHCGCGVFNNRLHAGNLFGKGKHDRLPGLDSNHGTDGEPDESDPVH